MIPDHAAKYLWDARQAAELVLRFVEGRTVADYLSDILLRSAVERQFEIVGEALAQLRRTFPDIAAEIPDLPHAVAFRNLLIHGYAKIDHPMVWETVQSSLPPLLEQVRARLAEAADVPPEPE